MNVIAQKLKEKSVNTIVLIDDAYDAIEKFDPSNVRDSQIEAFWDEMENPRTEDVTKKNAELLAFFDKNSSGKIVSRQNFDGDDIAQLWEHRGKLNSLDDELQQLFGQEFGKIAQVERIRVQLQNQCVKEDGGCIDIKTVGSSVVDNIGLVGEADIILLDYLMGDDRTPAEAKAKAEKIAKELYKKFSRKKLPLVVLMSSLSSVLEAQEEFQQSTGWLKGLFHCQLKDNLQDEIKLKTHLITWIERLSEGAIIHKFVTSIEKSLKKASKNFLGSIKNLSLDDYSYVNHFSLRTEGQPLGEYMLWLFNSHLGRLAFEADAGVRKRQHQVDKIAFEKLPFKQDMPSSTLIEMYDSALFNKHIGKEMQKRRMVAKQKENAHSEGVAVGGNIFKAEKKDGVSDGKTFDLPYLRLGLLFVKDEFSPVYMVINADCDLAFTADGERLPVPVVALVEGDLLEVSVRGKELKAYDTEFFKYTETGKPYHIKWDIKSVTFCEYTSFEEFLKNNGYELHALLRTTFALKVQQEYSTSFARIGLPVAPPLQHLVDVDFFYKLLVTNSPPKIVEDDGSESEMAPTLDNYLKKIFVSPVPKIAFLVKTREKSGDTKKQIQCHITPEFIILLHDACTNTLEIYEKETGNVTGNELKQLQQKTIRLKKTIENFDDWAYKETHYIIKDTVVPLDDEKTIGIYHDADIETVRKMGSSIILINLKDVDSD